VATMDQAEALEGADGAFRFSEPSVARWIL
jgi:hypothetical protein